MRLATIRTGTGEEPAVVLPDRGVARVGDLLADVDGDLVSILEQGRFTDLARAAVAAPRRLFRPRHAVRFAPPYRRPHKIWGIGLNYVEHAGDLAETMPEEPASFLKADHTVIGPGDPIPLPRQSRRVTAEAELGLVIGIACRDVPAEDALGTVLGVCPVLDQTAEDILQRNPRFLTRAKNFPGFFSFGPEIVPLSELADAGLDLAELEVSTVLNGRVHRRNTVSNMRYDPAFLVSFHSAVMPLFPGDVISTGTPGAVVVAAGDTVECRISGVGCLRNAVVAG
ncbi:MAG: fumarylacetoacetate hydrolase family protein [Actinomycetota bacterium]|nr:fumarylacetoacetate hydrolase family protein [Actinomycetota bacterium]